MAAHPKSLPEPPATHRIPKKKVTLKIAKPTCLRNLSREPIAAAKAKMHLLRLLDDVERDRKPITITKRGRAIAQLIPVEPVKRKDAFDQMLGRTKGWMKITGDIVSPDFEGWGPEWR